MKDPIEGAYRRGNRTCRRRRECCGRWPIRSKPIRPAPGRALRSSPENHLARSLASSKRRPSSESRRSGYFWKRHLHCDHIEQLGNGNRGAVAAGDERLARTRCCRSGVESERTRGLTRGWRRTVARPLPHDLELSQRSERRAYFGCEELRHNQCSFLNRIYKPRQIDIIAPTTIAYP